jgi:hypothetical protein
MSFDDEWRRPSSRWMILYSNSSLPTYYSVADENKNLKSIISDLYVQLAIITAECDASLTLARVLSERIQVLEDRYEVLEGKKEQPNNEL